MLQDQAICHSMFEPTKGQRFLSGLLAMAPQSQVKEGTTLYFTPMDSKPLRGSSGQKYRWEFPSTAGIIDQVPWWYLARIKYLDSVLCLPRTRELTNFLYQVLEEQPEGIVTVAIAAHYLSGEDKRSSQLDVLKEKFPDWTFPSAWVCTYDLFVF